MPHTTHTYATHLTWTGNRGTGTSHYRAYDRAHEVRFANKPTLLCSSDPAFRGDPSRHNPEELLVASLSSCHMLFFLFFAAKAGLKIDRYEDQAIGELARNSKGVMAMLKVRLRPQIVWAGNAPSAEQLDKLHHSAHEACYIANSVTTEVVVEAVKAGVEPEALT